MKRNMKNDKKNIIEHLEKMPIVEVACKQIGLPRTTYYRWRRDDEAFADNCDGAIDHSSAMINDMAESQLIQAIKEKNLTAIIFWLKFHHKAYETRINIKGTIKHQSEVITDEQFELVTKALRLGCLVKNDEKNKNE